jgi:hypothetical protein
VKLFLTVAVLFAIVEDLLRWPLSAAQEVPKKFVNFTGICRFVGVTGAVGDRFVGRDRQGFLFQTM